MSKKLFRDTLLASTMIAGMTAFATPAYAQDAQGTTGADDIPAGVQTQDTAGAAEETAQGDIVVTGTLIRNPNLEASSPVTVVGQDEIQLRQSNTAEQILRELPGATPNLGGNVNNGQVGSARVDLRGLGANRNIVLLDSRRVTPSNFSGIFDLNNVPLALIERVDVLTGGASTTYGADAVSGVVNFITRRDFAGVDAQFSQQISERGDGNVFRADLVLGANFDDGRGNAVLALGYQEADPVYFGDRPIAICTIPSNTGVCGGDSPTSVPTSIDLPGPATSLQISPDGNSLVAPYAPFNFNPFNVFTTPFERFNIFSAARYEAVDGIEVYARGLFSKNTVQSIIAASGIFGNNLTIPSNNPFLTPGLRNQICSLQGIDPASAACTNNPALPLGLVYRRSVELGPRVSTFVTQIFDIMAGVRANVTDRIQLDVYGAYGESENEQTLGGYVANSRVQQALNATNPTTCTVTTNGCVPLNIFGQQGSITQEMGGFIGGITSSTTNFSTLAQAHAVLSGDFGVTSPLADEPIGFAIGGEYREYRAERRPDNLAQVPGELGGAGGATLPLKGAFNVYEAFAELIAPLVSDRPFFNELTLEAGVRHSKYSVDAPNNPSFGATTYKFGLNWEPISEVRLRGNYQRAVRAPNIGELFAPVVQGLTNLLVDPCAAAAPVGNANLTAICIAQGAPPSTIGAIQQPAAGQANITTGGNPNLRPEKATTYTLGAVLQPGGALNGLTVTLDYYNIKIDEAITIPAVADTIAFCFNNITAASASSPACTSIRRNAANGRLSGTSTPTNPIPGLPGATTNEGLIKTDGFDLTVNYRQDIGFAQLNLNFAGNYTMNSEFRSRPGGVLRECVGLFSVNCGISTGLTVGSLTPKFAWNQRTTLSFGDVDVSLLWRHISKFTYEGLEENFAARGFTAASRSLFEGTITGTGPLVGRQVNFNRIRAFDYFDLSTRFAVTDNFELTLSVINLLDKQPPILGSSAGSTAFNGGNTFPSTYDTQGRRYAATARLKF
jgi:outer membrane receptor protein involved in Fe transport